MTVYRLYLESGPWRKKTMVHVLAVLGCVANGPTTEAALDRAPEAIRDYLSFLQRHGEAVEAEARVETEIAEHITEGVWLGNGDPSLVFGPDLEPLTEEDAEEYIQRQEWMHAELQDVVRGLSEEQLLAQPAPKGRRIQAILVHTLEAECAYLRAFGKLEGLPGLGSIVKKREGDLLDRMGYVREREFERILCLSWEERSERFVHWKYTRTARKVMRRMLEHQWEHLVELRERLGEPG
jgi:uncharacterized damage-inducible protein DinB/predicted RNase H-like HicB family nuclease